MSGQWMTLNAAKGNLGGLFLVNHLQEGPSPLNQVITRIAHTITCAIGPSR